MHYLIVILFFILIQQYGCSDPADTKPEPQNDQGTLARREKIKMLEAQVKSLRWENTRLALKVRTVDGNRMVKDKPTGLWHYDVERIPYTGMVVEKFPDGTPEQKRVLSKVEKMEWKDIGTLMVSSKKKVTGLTANPMESCKLGKKRERSKVLFDSKEVNLLKCSKNEPSWKFFSKGIEVHGASERVRSI